MPRVAQGVEVVDKRKVAVFVAEARDVEDIF